MTERFFEKGSRVLEGGCGLANHVYALQIRGFEAVGIDFSPKTVSLLNEAVEQRGEVLQYLGEHYRLLSGELLENEFMVTTVCQLKWRYKSYQTLKLVCEVEATSF